MKGVVDTSAIALALPQNIAERLGLVTRGTAVVTCADDRKDERPVVGPVTVRVVGRHMNTDAIVVPPSQTCLSARSSWRFWIWSPTVSAAP